MPKAYSVTLYYNTGFNRGNVPDSPALLATAQSKTYDAVWEWQDRYLGAIKIKADYDDVKEADYLKLGDSTYYVINSVQALAAPTILLNITMDPLTSIGGVSALNVLSGWVERAHVKDDKLFGNVTPEPWAPTGRLVVRNKHWHETKDVPVLSDVAEKLGGATELNVVVANVDLTETQYYATTLVNQAGSEPSSVTYPRRPPLPDGVGTRYLLPNADATGTQPPSYSYDIPLLQAYNLDDEGVRAGVSSIQDIGIRESITAMYTIPAACIGAIFFRGDGAQFITTLAGRIDFGDTQIPLAYKTVKNKKAIALFNQVVLQSQTSGDAQSYEAYEVYHEGDANFKVTIYADPSPGGTLYCQPTYYSGAKTRTFERAVTGGPWLNAGYLFEGEQGGALTVANAKRANLRTAFDADIAAQALNDREARSALDLATGVFGAVGGAVDTSGPIPSVDVLGGLSNVASQAVNYVFNARELDRQRTANQYHAAYTMGDNLFRSSVQANVKAPEIAYPIVVNAAAYMGNSFLAYQVTLNDNDLARFDAFLTRYGYAQDKAIEASDLTNRTNYNYIKTRDVHVKSASAPRNMLELVEQMLDAGVRIWHVAPSPEAYDDNPVKEG